MSSQPRAMMRNWWEWRGIQGNIPSYGELQTWNLSWSLKEVLCFFFKSIQDLIENQSLCRTKNISSFEHFSFILIRLESMPIDLARAIC